MPVVQFRREEVARRNTERDAVLVIDNVVYDLTNFLMDHPGGIDVLNDNLGGDASEYFHDVGHSEYARDWMKSFAIGEVVEEERREVIPWPPSIIDAEPEPGASNYSLSGLIDACSGPLGFALLALVLYMYMFPPEEAQ